MLSESFKTVNGKEACTTVAFVEGVVTPRNSDFWKVLWKSPLFDCVLTKFVSYTFHKSFVFVDLTPCITFGKCFA